MSTIYDFVKRQRDDYRTETVEITDGYEFSQFETLRTIELYHNSKFLSGKSFMLSRESRSSAFHVASSNCTRFPFIEGPRETCLSAIA
jgi:hypothetical protein